MKKIISLIALALMLTTANAQLLQRTIELSGTFYNYSEIAEMETQRAVGNNIPHALINVETLEDLPHFQLLELDPNDGAPVKHFDYLIQTNDYRTTNATCFDVRNGFYYVAGTVIEDATNDKKLFACQINVSTGAVVWARVIESTTNTHVKDISVDRWGNQIYITGTEFLNNGSRMFVTRLDGNGNTVWYNQVNVPHEDTEGRSIDFFDADELYVAGVATDGTVGDLDGLLIRMDANGNILADSRIEFFVIGATDQLRLRHIHIEKHGTDVYMLAQTWAGSGHNGTIFFRRMDTNLNQLVFRRYLGSGAQPEMAAVSIDYDHVLIGGITEFSSGGNGFVQMSLDLLGNDISTVNYTNPITVGNIGTAGSVFLSKTRAVMLSLHNTNTATEHIVHEYYSDFSLQTYCEEDVVLLPEIYHARNVWQPNASTAEQDYENQQVPMGEPVVVVLDDILCINAAAKSGLNSDEAAVNVSCMPNPFNDELQVTSENSEIAEITIYNMTGKLVYQSKLSETFIATLSLEELTSGVYLINVRTADDKFMRERLVKQ